MTVFIGIYKAIYSYEPQTPEELALQEDDFLYLLEKSEVDDWWTVKKRVIGSDAEEPSGLVPSNYIETAPVISKVKASYDYEQVQNPDEELTFHENDIFEVYDDKDQDWLLVKSLSTNEFGFVPGNYVEPYTEGAMATSGPITANLPTAQPTTATSNVGAATFMPPPQRADRAEYEKMVSESKAEQTMDREEAPKDNEVEEEEEEEEEEAPPEMPARPTSQMEERKISRDRTRSRQSFDDYSESERNHNRSNDRANNRRSGYNMDDSHETYHSQYRSWNVQEIEGRKKRKAKIAIGSNRITFIPSKGAPEEWTIDKLVSYDNEKKHVFLEFIDPYKNLEIHTGNNETSAEIMSVLGEFKGASRGNGLREVELASRMRKQGRILYDFIAESVDELSVREGELVYIINDKKSKDWWMCESVDSGKKGVVPAQFVDQVQGKSSSSGGFLNSIKKMTKGKSGASDDWKGDGHQEMSSPKKSRHRLGSLSSRRKRSSSTGNVNNHSDSSKKDFPDPKKSRLWVDRSGTFKVDAQFIGCAEGKIHLHKANGVKIAVGADKLSEDDLIYVEQITGFSLDKFKPKKAESRNARDSERERRRRLREQEEKERDRRLREREISELKKARQLLDEERSKLQAEKELPPIKPPRPQASISSQNVKSKKTEYDWFEFFLNCGVDVSNCQRYTINFDREQISEDMMQDINPSMLRTLSLREGDIVRVMKFLDNKFGRENNMQLPAVTGGLFSQPDGSLKAPVETTSNNLQQQLLPQATAPAIASAHEDDAWTAKPAAKSQPNLVTKSSEFTGSMQDLLDLEPLEPKKMQAPEPNLKDLEPVKTGTQATPSLSSTLTGGRTVVPLDPFKTGGNNILPIATGFVMMPFATGGLMPMQRTGGVPQTTFGTQLTGGILPVQKTSNGLIPITTTGGMMPQTSFGTQSTGNLMPLQRTGGLLPISTTGGMNIMPQTSFNVPPPGSVLPVQRTSSGLAASNITGGALPINTFPGTSLTGNMNGIPQTSFSNQLTGGANMIPQTTFVNQLTGGANMMPQTSFSNQLTGGIASMPQTNFGNQLTSASTLPPQTSFGAAQTPGIMQLQGTGGPAMMATSTLTGQQNTGFQPQSQFGMNLQRTGGAIPLPQNQSTGNAMLQQQQPNLNNGVNTINQGLQNTFISQPVQQQALQNQPTGFGFGNGPQQQVPAQARQANILNASADNPFGF
ncbi:hypothetical protein KAFR_0I01040 [Kazachstania africana CBS 2517]|uniref:Actin cytoskeleton-regulatory complex protein SLA1 n=1 Tax=Kazachstania africana (strain ATCC 22294 / BCRC 22015 / CBS 2517 / CECT 1963 / NBRC 1671 / NRRL Y-8276) TaxID=1071382 RepID=H2AZT5_KAZAF|nr:hypothetical protein KAFR_0I01040 [Kazachstania africana CBS 2517]CCF59885.1 hypothetical protein KAFR_0I01040 [Kazachstania africana CBS 2517]